MRSPRRMGNKWGSWPVLSNNGDNRKRRGCYYTFRGLLLGRIPPLWFQFLIWITIRRIYIFLSLLEKKKKKEKIHLHGIYTDKFFIEYHKIFFTIDSNFPRRRIIQTRASINLFAIYLRLLFFPLSFSHRNTASSYKSSARSCQPHRSSYVNDVTYLRSIEKLNKQTRSISTGMGICNGIKKQ